MALSKTASALGLYRYNCDPPESSLFHRFYSEVSCLFSACGIVITYVGVHGSGYPEKFTKAGGRVHNRMLKSNFSGVEGVSLVANPSGSDSPAYDSFATASIGYVEANREILAYAVVDESFLKLRSPEYDRLLQFQIELCRWDFGYGFAAAAEKQPDFHILGLDNGKLSPAEFKSLCTWYNAPPDVRMTHLRAVYPYNILNEGQFAAQLTDGKTLRQFIEDQPACPLTRLTDYGLHLWLVPDGDVAKLQDALVKSGVLV